MSKKSIFIVISILMNREAVGLEPISTAVGTALVSIVHTQAGAATAAVAGTAMTAGLVVWIKSLYGKSLESHLNMHFIDLRNSDITPSKELFPRSWMAKIVDSVTLATWFYLLTHAYLVVCGIYRLHNSDTINSRYTYLSINEDSSKINTNNITKADTITIPAAYFTKNPNNPPLHIARFQFISDGYYPFDIAMFVVDKQDHNTIELINKQDHNTIELIDKVNMIQSGNWSSYTFLANYTSSLGKPSIFISDSPHNQRSILNKTARNEPSWSKTAL